MNNPNLSQTLDLHGARVLVTGATGFIGARLVDYLLFHYQAEVRALVRGFGRAVHLARLPVELVAGDLLDPASLEKAIQDCDFVFHCAAGMSGEDGARRAVTVEGTRNILEAAVQAGVKRFIHVSSIAVHGPDPGLVVDENSALMYTGDVYSDAKIDAEKLVFEYCESHGLPVSVLRPTIVYGPRSGSWTAGPLGNIQSGKFTLIDGGRGIANHVYVDDVVQAMLLAAVRPEAVGEAFIVSYGEGVTWKEFFSHYAGWLGVELPNMDRVEIEQQRKKVAQLEHPLYLGLSFVASPRIQTVARQLPAVGGVINLASKAIPGGRRQAILDEASSLRQAKLNPPKLPKQQVVELFSATGLCKIDKARALLGFEPQFDLARGMQLTEAWARYTKLV